MQIGIIAQIELNLKYSLNVVVANHKLVAIVPIIQYVSKTLPDSKF